MRPASRFVLALVLATSVVAQTPESAPAPGRIDPNTARAARLSADVSRIRQLPIVTPVKAATYDLAELKRFVTERIAVEAPPAKMEAAARGLKALRLIPPALDLGATMTNLLLEQIAGFYDPDTKELRLVARAPTTSQPAAAAVGAALYGIDAGTEADIAMAHEICHALQDQNVGLKTLPLDLEDDEDMARASQSVVEGDATLLMIAWLMNAKMKQPIAAILMPEIRDRLRGISAAALPGGAALDAAPVWLKETLVSPYLDGMAFCSTICAGDETFAPVTAALRKPPLSTEQILHPEKYLPGPLHDDPQTVRLPALDATLGGGWTRVTTNTVGELGMRVMLGQTLPRPAANIAASGWDGDRYDVWGHADSPDCLVWFTTWDSEAEASRFEVALLTHIAAQHPGVAITTPAGFTARWNDSETTAEGVVRRGADVLHLRAVPRRKVKAVVDAVFAGTTKVEIHGVPAKKEAK